jgi:hypothetical protein
MRRFVALLFVVVSCVWAWPTCTLPDHPESQILLLSRAISALEQEFMRTEMIARRERSEMSLQEKPLLPDTYATESELGEYSQRGARITELAVELRKLLVQQEALRNDWGDRQKRRHESEQRVISDWIDADPDDDRPSYPIGKYSHPCVVDAAADPETPGYGVRVWNTLYEACAAASVEGLAHCPNHIFLIVNSSQVCNEDGVDAEASTPATEADRNNGTHE